MGSLLYALLLHIQCSFYGNPFIDPLTVLFRANGYERFDEALIWGFIMGLAVLLNVRRLNTRINPKQTILHRISNGFASASFYFIIVSCIFLGENVYVLHSITSGIFAVFAGISVLISLFRAVIKRKNVIVLLIGFFIGS